MKMDDNIRVRTDRKYQTLYNDLKNFAFGDMHEIFFLCVSLGYKAKKQKSLGKDRDERFWSRTITPDEWACYYAIMIEANNMDFSSIQDDKQVIACMEEYANAGMEILLDEFLSGYIVNGSEGPTLVSSGSQELPKIVLSYIYEQLPETSLR
jgi:hypothetical protein